MRNERGIKFVQRVIVLYSILIYVYVCVVFFLRGDIQFVYRIDVNIQILVAIEGK